MGATTSSELVEESVADIQLQVDESAADILLQVEKSIAKSRGGLSYETLKEFTKSFSKVDQAVGEAILSQQRNVLNDVYLRNLVKEYYDADFQTLQFLNELERCLRVLADRYTHLLIAINKYENWKLDECLESLEKFMAKGDPSQEKFFLMLSKLYERQQALLKKVTEMHDENVKKIKKWRVNLIAFVTAAAYFVTRVSLTIAEAYPPVAVVANGVSSLASYIASILKAQTEDERMNNHELTKVILDSTQCVIKNLAHIHTLADNLRGLIDSLKENINEASLNSIDLIMKPVKDMTKRLQEDSSKLTDCARECKESIMKRRNDVADLIINKFT